MTNLHVKDGASASKYVKTDGAGTDGNPYVPHHVIGDGEDVVQGSLADAIVAAGAVGTISAKLRRVTQALADLETELALKADLTETQPTSLADGADVTSGSIADDMVAAGAAGSISAKLRRISSDIDAVKAAVETLVVSSGSIHVTNVALVDATGQGDVPVTLDGEAVAISSGSIDVTNVIPVDATGQGDVPVTLDSEAVDISDRAGRDVGKVDIADIDGFASVKGQKTMAESLPAVLASDQSAIPVTVSSGSHAIPDGDDVTQGAIADDMVAAGAVGTVSAKLRRISSDLDAVKTAVETIDNAISGNEMQVDIVAQPAAEQTTPTFHNLTLVGADTQYCQPLPANTRALQFQCRTAFDVRYAFETGKVAGPASPYSTLKSGAVWYKENIKTSGSLYLASSEAGVVTEIESWA